MSSGAQSVGLTFLEGSYEEHVAINGRPSWILNKNYALFFSPTEKDWVIGLLREIGTPYGFIFATSDGEELCPKDVPSSSWQHVSSLGSSTFTAGSVTVECLTSRNERKNFVSKSNQFEIPSFFKNFLPSCLLGPEAPNNKLQITAPYPDE